MRRVIGLYGKKGVGKSFVCNRISKELESRSIACLEAAFADPIKEFSVSVLGLPPEGVYGDDSAKMAQTQYDWSQMTFKHSKSGAMTCREVMQVVGTEYGREIWGDNIWIDCLKRRVDAFFADQSGDACVLVPDVRFDNEVKALWDFGAKIWVVRGPQRIGSESQGDAHASEKLRNDLEGDAIILNDRGFTEYDIDRQVVELIDQELSE